MRIYQQIFRNNPEKKNFTKTCSVGDRLSHANRRTNGRTEMKKQIAFCFAEGLNKHKFWELEILPFSDETMGRHPLKWPVHWVQWLKTAVRVGQKWTRHSQTFHLRTGSHFRSEILCSLRIRGDVYRPYQGVLNFAYCRQKPLELSHISGFYPIRTSSVWNVWKRDVENTRFGVKIGPALENGQLPSRTTICEIQYGTNIPAGLRTCALPFFIHN